MEPLNLKKTTSSLAPPIFCVAKNWQLKDKRFPIAILWKFILEVFSFEVFSFEVFSFKVFSPEVFSFRSLFTYKYRFSYTVQEPILPDFSSLLTQNFSGFFFAIKLGYFFLMLQTMKLNSEFWKRGETKFGRVGIGDKAGKFLQPIIWDVLKKRKNVFFTLLLIF